MKKNKTLYFILPLLISACSRKNNLETTICKWQGDKKAAISITYDDGIINQFTVARPIMNELDFKATFFVITGKLNRAGKGKFIGRPISEIIEESGRVKTDSVNFFERASAIAFSGVPNAVYYHTRAGSLYESGRVAEAYSFIDEGYEKLRNNVPIITDEIIYHDNKIDTSTWEDFRNYIKEGHEISSHTVTHPKLAVLDEVNLLYELEQSKADIERELGKASTFSAEGPYGTEDERVMEYAHKIYPALRNRMPEDWLEEINRGSNMEANTSDKEYVQWQRGPVNSVSMENMKAWVDTAMADDNIWLVLVFHGIEGVGWEPRTGDELKEYFGYMKAKESNLWIDTFGNVTKYLRERKATTITQNNKRDKIEITLNSDLDSEVYNVPLTLKTYVPDDWNKVESSNGVPLEIQKDEKGRFVIHEASPLNEMVIIKKV
ncbi:polysaccharide deacetylase family protein [Jiulongibacter sediminis]|uniref:polysaccharide deacetylase family protein n=1 Tax=Jiulongibacter sediminis TaxID=1605367 RepID=UPI0026EA6C38|nr:polysaccharide deacetylase family protein [Jiulongibacter sediminis]